MTDDPLSDLLSAQEEGEAAAMLTWQEILNFRREETASVPLRSWTLPEHQILKGKMLHRIAALDKFDG